MRETTPSKSGAFAAGGGGGGGASAGGFEVERQARSNAASAQSLTFGERASATCYSAPMRFDDTTLARLRPPMMKRGLALATMLADLLGGKGKAGALDAMLGSGKPGEKPEERIRRALDQVEGQRKLLDARDDAFGRCGECGEDLGLPALSELPWADRCRAHA
jgi:hypothetical protein